MRPAFFSFRLALAAVLLAPGAIALPSAVLAQGAKPQEQGAKPQEQGAKAKETPAKPEPSKESAIKELKDAYWKLELSEIFKTDENKEAINKAREEFEDRLNDYLKRHDDSVREAKEALDAAAGPKREAFQKAAKAADEKGLKDVSEFALNDPRYKEAQKKYDEALKKYDEKLRVGRELLMAVLEYEYYWKTPFIPLTPSIPLTMGPAPSPSPLIEGHIGLFAGANANDATVAWSPSPVFGVDGLFLAQQSRFNFNNAAFNGGFEVGATVYRIGGISAVPPIFAGFVYDMAFDAGGSQRRDALFVTPTGVFPAQQGFVSDYTSTARVAVGLENAFGDSLGLQINPYATAGFAFGHVSVSDDISFGGGFFNSGQWSGTKTGWAAGGGVRIPVGRFGNFQMQCLHIDLGAVANTAPHSVLPLAYIGASHQIAVNRITAGFNFNLSLLGL